MRQSKVASIFLIVCISAVFAENFEDFRNFQQNFGKKYVSPREFLERKAVFEQNLEIIAEHNKRFENGEVDYKLAVNQFADMTQEEFQDAYLGK